MREMVFLYKYYVLAYPQPSQLHMTIAEIHINVAFIYILLVTIHTCIAKSNTYSVGDCKFIWINECRLNLLFALVQLVKSTYHYAKIYKMSKRASV